MSALCTALFREAALNGDVVETPQPYALGSMGFLVPCVFHKSGNQAVWGHHSATYNGEAQAPQTIPPFYDQQGTI